MFDIGWQELFIIVVVGIIVIGPKELPRAARTIAGFVRKARMMAHEFQDGVDDMIQQADLDDIKKQMTATGDDLKDQLKDKLDPDGTISHDLELNEFGVEEDDYDEDELGEVEQIASQSAKSDKKQQPETKTEANTPQLQAPSKVKE
jgi:sec-independent protein translocase protein TatB